MRTSTPSKADRLTWEPDVDQDEDRIEKGLGPIGVIDIDSESQASSSPRASLNDAKSSNSPFYHRGLLGYVVRFVRYLTLVLLNEKSPLQFVGIFLLNLLPVAVWISTFKEARLIPASIRPYIHVDLLPAWEKYLYETPTGLIAQSAVLAGIYYAVIRTPWALTAASLPFILNILNFFAQDLNRTKDLFAWISYGVVHFISPYLTAVWLWFFAPPGVIGVYGWAFGFQNLAGVFTHLSFPNASPWYQSDAYGYGTPPKPGNYSMPGSAAGLVRVDAVLGTHIYAHAFRASPLVFGAFPSLHSGFAVMNFFFLARYSPKRGKYLCGAFVFWQWWSTIYLLHHWRIDLIGGALYSTAAFLAFLPSLKKYESRSRHRAWCGWERLWYYDEWTGYVTPGRYRPVPAESGSEEELT
ncbi:MAG: hypothetical protein M1819_005749 [Sarea resinae]|nr:MAG: hypothetical protein M1819_005749 [Sarea resinae]